MKDAETDVWVRRQHDDHRKARYPLDDIRGVNWDSRSGGVQAKAPQYLLFGYADCDGMVEGEIAHSGVHGPCPHSIKVCILKADNDPAVYRLLAERAGEKPTRPPSCAQQALRLVAEAGVVEGPVLRQRLKALGFGRIYVSQVLPRLEREGVLVARRAGRKKVYELPQGGNSGTARRHAEGEASMDTATAYERVTFYGDTVAPEVGKHDLRVLVAEVVSRLPESVQEWLLEDTNHLFIGGHGQHGEFIDCLLHPLEFEDGLVRIRIVFLSEELLGATKEEALWTIAHEIAHSRLGHSLAGYEAEVQADRLVRGWGFAEPEDRPKNRERYRP